MFQPKRPLVKWSKLENRFANRNGGSNEVDAVMANDRFLVTAAIAEIGYRYNHVSESISSSGSLAILLNLQWLGPS